jgi:hypothetical protein
MDDILISASSVLRTTPARWNSLMQLSPDESLTAAPAPGEWSAVQCLQHLVDTERGVFPQRVGFLLAGVDFPAFDPDAQGTAPDAAQSPAALAAEFARLRGASLTVLASVAASDLSRKARHSELGVVTLGELLHEWAAHDLMHTVQAERALMQPFIRGCGPWQPFFRDHLAGAIDS